MCHCCFLSSQQQHNRLFDGLRGIRSLSFSVARQLLKESKDTRFQSLYKKVPIDQLRAAFNRFFNPTKKFPVCLGNCLLRQSLLMRPHLRLGPLQRIAYCPCQFVKQVKRQSLKAVYEWAILFTMVKNEKAFKSLRPFLDFLRGLALEHEEGWADQTTN